MKAWTDEDKATAAAQGWELREIWCMTKQRVELQIFKDDRSKIFLTDKDARLFVMERAAHADKLATHSMRLAFNSRLGKKK